MMFYEIKKAHFLELLSPLNTVLLNFMILFSHLLRSVSFFVMICSLHFPPVAIDLFYFCYDLRIAFPTSCDLFYFCYDLLITVSTSCYLFLFCYDLLIVFPTSCDLFLFCYDLLIAFPTCCDLFYSTGILL
jgi:hypothetical protein